VPSNDIGIVQLAAELKFDEKVSPICLPAPSAEDPDRRDGEGKAEVAGQYIKLGLISGVPRGLRAVFKKKV
jgi:hypothetical protein